MDALSKSRQVREYSGKFTSKSGSLPDMQSYPPGTTFLNCTMRIRERAGEYLNRFEIKAGLYKLLRKYNGGLPIPAERTTACIKDKACLKARCNDNGIVTTLIFWIFEKGQIRKIDWQDEKLPEIDLFVKPLAGQGGGGTSRWNYLGSGQFRGGDGKVATGVLLIEYLRTASEHKIYLVQPRLINHRKITDLANGTRPLFM